MSKEQFNETDPRIKTAVSELREIITRRWPTASFAVVRGEDPEGIYLDATVDVEDPDEVIDLVVDRLLELQVDQGLPVHVVPLRTPERAAALSKQGRRRKVYSASTLETLLRPIP